MPDEWEERAVLCIQTWKKRTTSARRMWRKLLRNKSVCNSEC